MHSLFDVSDQAETGQDEDDEVDVVTTDSLIRPAERRAYTPEPMEDEEPSESTSKSAIICRIADRQKSISVQLQVWSALFCP